MSDFYNEDGTFKQVLEKVKPIPSKYERVEYRVPKQAYQKTHTRMNKEVKRID